MSLMNYTMKKVGRQREESWKETTAFGESTLLY
jgi:hypothetical protein